MTAPHIFTLSNPMATIEQRGCRITVRRFDGPVADELFVHCSPIETGDAGLQTETVYRGIVDILAAEGASFGAVVTETLFLRDIEADIDSVRDSRLRVLAMHEAAHGRCATTEIEQPPLSNDACLAVSVQAVVPRNGVPVSFESIGTKPDCGCPECANTHALRIDLGGEVRFHAGGLCGAGNNVHEQTLGMFTLAEDLLHKAGMDFHDVVRTWIYLRDIDRDYGDLNPARRAFFEARGIEPVPASTGIGGGPVYRAHDLCLGIYAVKGARPPARKVMTSPTLNEAMQYGADFVRGLNVVESNRVALHVSGTASINEHGETAHVGDFDAQAERMLINIAALLEGQGADFGDVVSAITYLKHPSDIERLRAAFRKAGFKGFPTSIVEAPICRPELLCETEVLALLPIAAANL